MGWPGDEYEHGLDEDGVCSCCSRAEAKLFDANKKSHDANGLAQRLVGLVEGAVMSLRALRTYGECPKAVGDKLETQLFVELQRGGMASWPLQPLLEHAIYVVAELERRGVKAFKMAVDADGNIIGPFGGENG